MDFNKQLRFGLRKSRVYGTLCSAILGAFIMAGPIVHADEAQPSNTTTEAVSTDTSKTATLATEVVTDHASQTAILATKNTTVADTTVANTTTENTETSPYVSDKAVAAAKEAFDNIDTSKALTAEDIKVPETLTTEQEGITETLKERYDDLPAPVRSVTKKVIINDENNGSLGATYSVSGIVTVNAHYFHESNPQQAVETLYHEVGHTIDGATYKKTASGEYSLSRDEAVQPLLKTAYPGYANYEAFASLFGTYMLQETGQKEIKTATDAEIKKYFDVLLNGFTRPTENKYTKDLIATVNSLKANGKMVVYDGLVHVATPEQAQKENQATIARLTNTRSRRSLSTLTRYTAAVPKSEVAVTMTSLTPNRDVVAQNAGETLTKLNDSRMHELTVTTSGKGQLDENSYIDVTVEVNLPTKNGKVTPFTNDFAATGQTESSFQGNRQTAKLSLAGLTAGTEKGFTIKTNGFTSNTTSPEKLIKTSTYKLVIDGKVTATKVVTETFVPFTPTLSKLKNEQTFELIETNTGTRGKFNDNSVTNGIFGLNNPRPYGIIDIQIPKNATMIDRYNQSLEAYKVIDGDTAHYLIPQEEKDRIAYNHINTSVDAEIALKANPSQKVLTQNGLVTYYYSDQELPTDLATLKTAKQVTAPFDIVTKLNVTKEGMGALELATQLGKSKLNVLRTNDANYYNVRLSNGSQRDIRKEIPVNAVELTFNKDNKAISDNTYEIEGNQSSRFPYNVYNADTNELIGTIQGGRLKLPANATHLRIEPKNPMTVGYGPNASIDIVNYNIFFNNTVATAKQWKKDMDNATEKETQTRFDAILLDTNHQMAAKRVDTLTITNDIAAMKIDNDTHVVFTPTKTNTTVSLPIRTSAIFRGDLPVTAFTNVEMKDPYGIITRNFGTSEVRASDDFSGAGNMLYTGPITDEAHRPAGGTFIDTSYNREPARYNQFLFKTILPSGTHIYDIPIRVTTSDGVSTVDNNGKLSASNVTEATLRIVTYDAKVTGTESILETETTSGSDITLDDVTKGFTATTYVNNFTDSAVDHLEAMSYIPKQSLEGSTASTTLKDAITAPTGWKVQYTTDTLSGNYKQDRQLTFTDSVTDYSKVTAVKFVSTQAVPAQKATVFNLPLTFNGTPDNNRINYRSVLLTNDKELLSTPVTATADTGDIVYNYVNKKTGDVLKTVTTGKRFTKETDTHTFDNKIKVDGHNYKRTTDSATNTVTTPVSH